MAKRASQAGDAPTDRPGAPCLGTEVNTRGKRRRWTAERKHQIVAEGMEPGVSAAMVARKHGISRGQFYAWRHYALALKGNQGTLHDDVRTFLDDPETELSVSNSTVDGDHGRIETPVIHVERSS